MPTQNLVDSRMDSDSETSTILETITDTESEAGSIVDFMDEGIDVLYMRIKSIHDANKATIKMIDDSADKQVKYYQYNAPPVISEDGSTCVFKLKVTPLVDPAKKLVSDRKKELDLINIFDIFNLKIDYSGSTYDDLKRLNKEMFDGVERYNMFYDEDSKKGRVELKKFVQNFQIIQKHLDDVLFVCKDQPNKSEEIEAILRDANMKIIDAVGVGCRYSPPKIRRISDAIPVVTASMEQTLCTWIGRRLENCSLKYRASVDGFGAFDFHKKCDGVTGLLVVVQSDKDFVFGGYTGGASFHSNGGYITSIRQKPFLFSLVNSSGTQPIKCDNSSPHRALNGFHSHSASFGGGLDLHICDNANVQTGSQVELGHTYWSPPEGAHMFTGVRDGWTVKELLAFQVG
jgi:hypothetical protein